MFSFLKQLFCIKSSIADYEIYDRYHSNNLNNVDIADNLRNLNNTHNVDNLNNNFTARLKYTVININNMRYSHGVNYLPKVYNIDSECCICFEEEILYAVLKCSHCVCIQCAEKITKCPLCGV